MSSTIAARLALGLTCAAVATTGALELAPAAANAQSSTPTATVAIDNCHVKRSSTFNWAYCGIVTDASSTANVTVSYSVNLPTFKPNTGGTWFSRTGTLRFEGGGQQLRNIKFAVRNISLAKLRQRLRVTLSNAKGATITNATAVALGS